MKKCPVHNCPAKIQARVAVAIAAVMTVVAVTLLVLHFMQSRAQD